MFTEQARKRVRYMRDLVQDYLRFKAKIYYLEGSKHHSGTFYGEEWSVTLDQVRFKKVDRIELDRYKGYMDLVNMIEKGYLAGKYATALIYEHDGQDYNILCRKYTKGELHKELVQDPVFDETNSKIVLVPIIKTIPGTPHSSIAVEPLTNFKINL